MSQIRSKNRHIILKAACEVFARRGYAGSKIQDIADLAGLPKPNVYYYFNNKENLYREVLISIVEPLLAATSPLEISDDPAQALSEYIRIKLDISRQHPQASKVFASEIMHGAPHLPEDITARLIEQTQASVARMQQWIDQGRMAKVDPLHLLFTIWASTQTYADFDWQIGLHLGRSQLAEQDYQAAGDLLCQMVLKGCGLSPPEAK